MRILIFAFEQYPPMFGGGTVFMHQLALHLQWAGIGVEVIAAAQPRAEEFDRQQPFTTKRFGASPGKVRPNLVGRLRNRLSYFALFRTEIKRFRPDAILCAEWRPSGIAAYILTLGHKVPFFVTAFGNEIITLPSGRLSQAFMPTIRRRVFRAARSTFAISNYTKEKVVNLGIATEKIKIIPPGIDKSYIATTPRKMPESPRLITVCRLVQRKGCDTVIRALPHLIEAYPDIQYDIVGQGPEQSNLQQLAADLGLAQRVKFWGQVSDEQKTALYDASSGFVMPARERKTNFEGFGIVYLEAMARHVLVIGSPTGGIPDVIEDDVTGLLVPPDNPIALAEAIDKLLSSPELRDRLVRCAVERVKMKFTWDIVATQYAHYLEEQVRV